jgi:hypothetical protein
MGQTMGNKVILILDTGFAEKIIPIAKHYPVWVIDSPENHAFVDEYRKNIGGEVTVFSALNNEPRPKTCERIVFSLDDHYNEYSGMFNYDEIDVIGVQLNEVNLDLFRELGFERFLPTYSGFSAHKNVRPQSDSSVCEFLEWKEIR